LLFLSVNGVRVWFSVIAQGLVRGYVADWCPARLAHRNTTSEAIDDERLSA
jgi:hypothetical protein